MFAQDSLVIETGRLRKFAYKLTRNSADADDLVQSTCLRALEKNDLFDTGTNLFGWTSKIMYNLFVSGYHRRTKFESRLDPDIYLDQQYSEPMQDTLLEIENMKRSLEILSPNHRDVMIMVCVKGLSYQEVADELHILIGTVRSRLSRARSQLKTIMEERPKNHYAHHGMKDMSDKKIQMSMPTHIADYELKTRP